MKKNKISLFFIVFSLVSCGKASENVVSVPAPQSTPTPFVCPQNHHNTPTLIAFGESLVAASDGYPTQLAALINLPIQNFGVGGSMFFANNQYPTELCVEINPDDVVTIQPGINDAFFAKLDPDYLNKYKNGLSDVMDRLNKTGAIILFGTTEHVFESPDEKGINDIIDQYAKITRDMLILKNYNNLYLVDTNVIFIPTLNNMLNNHHPNTMGYQTIANGYLSVYNSI